MLHALERGEIKHGQKTVVVIRYEGPQGGPGMPEMRMRHLSVPSSLLPLLCKCTHGFACVCPAFSGSTCSLLGVSFPSVWAVHFSRNFSVLSLSRPAKRTRANSPVCVFPRRLSCVRFLVALPLLSGSRIVTSLRWARDCPLYNSSHALRHLRNTWRFRSHPHERHHGRGPRQRRRDDHRRPLLRRLSRCVAVSWGGGRERGWWRVNEFVR